MPTCFICIGTNYGRKENLLLAHQCLMALFPSIRFAAEEETEPLHFTNSALFTNQVATFDTILSEREVKSLLKKIERDAGRSPQDKAIERVSLDIDLLIYDGRVLKPGDRKRAYVERGIEELNNLK